MTQRQILALPESTPEYGPRKEKNDLNEKSAAVFAVRRANYTHRRKGVFNAQSIEDLRMGGNVRYRTVCAWFFVLGHS